MLRWIKRRRRRRPRRWAVDDYYPRSGHSQPLGIKGGLAICVLGGLFLVLVPYIERAMMAGAP